MKCETHNITNSEEAMRMLDCKTAERSVETPDVSVERWSSISVGTSCVPEIENQAL